MYHSLSRQGIEILSHSEASGQGPRCCFTAPLPVQPDHAAGQVALTGQVPLICSDAQPEGTPILQLVASPHYPLEPWARTRALLSSCGCCLEWVAWDHGPGSLAHICPPAPQSVRRLFVTGKSCHLPCPLGGSLHASSPIPGQGNPNLLARPTISCFSPTASHLCHLVNTKPILTICSSQAPNGTPYLLLHITPANPLNVCSSVTSSKKPT